MKQAIVNVSLLVNDYDEALDFFVSKLHFDVVEDTPVPAQNKRWVVIAPPQSQETRIVLGKASTPEQAARVGDQTGGRVFFSLATDDFERDYTDMKSAGIVFVRDPKEEPYGMVAVFKDLYGNLWDLIWYKSISRKSN